MSATIHNLPPRYRVAWKDGEREGWVEDEATGRDWDSRRLDEAIAMMEQLREHFRAILFWVSSGG